MNRKNAATILAGSLACCAVAAPRAGAQPNPCPSCPANTLYLETDTVGGCQGAAGDVLEVRLWMVNLTMPVTGFQAFLQFDDSLLDYLPAQSSYSAAPFPVHIGTIASAYSGVGHLDLNGSVAANGSGTATDSLLATLQFTVVAECAATSVDFRPNPPFLSELSSQGNPVATALVGTGSFLLDNTAPTISCPAAATIQCPTAPTPVNTGSASAMDNCTAAPTIGHSDSPSTRGACAGTYSFVRTWTAVDGCGNSSSCPQMISVVDTTPPTISCPGNQKIECPNTPVFGTPTAMDNCDPSPSIATVGADTTTPGACPQEYSVTRTWQATDACGNVSAPCSQTIMVSDDTAPTINGPGNIVVNADAGDCSAVVTYSVTASDDCDSSVTPMCAPASGSTFGSGTTTVNCSATDDCGNTANQSFTVTVNAANSVTVTVVLDDVNLGAGSVTRCIKFIVKNGSTCAAPVYASGDFTGSPASASLSFDVPCGSWTQICAKDEQHTIFDTQPLMTSGTSYATTSPLVLLGGDTDNDSDIDIDDVTFLLFRFGLPDPDNAGCAPWGLAIRGANFDDVGVVGSADYSILASNWQAITSCPCSEPQVQPPPPLPVRTQVDAALLPADVALRADLNHDGRIDCRDVQELERRHHLGAQLSSKMQALQNAATPAGADGK